MNAANIRLGFATNSSSTHSIILTEKTLLDNSPSWDLEFQWDNFTCASEKEKARYMAVAAYLHYTNRMSVGNREAAILADNAFQAGIEPQAFDECGIDHQSCPTFPMPRLQDQGMFPFWEWINRSVVRKNGVVILGGNDNSDGHPDRGAGQDLSVPWKCEASVNTPDGRWVEYGGVYLYDPHGYVCIFNKHNGTRVRYTMPDGISPTFSTVPELVDMKITNYCTEDCKFCYQNSGPQGNHASLGNLQSLAWNLGRMGVFEVALGGGEPTLHPAFPEVLKAFAENGIVPNFSTRNEKWIRVQSIADAVREYAGAFALSIDQQYGVHDAKRMANQVGKPPTVHVVLGTCNQKDLAGILAACAKERVRIVLLAYKGGIGRAPEKPQYEIGEWWNTVKGSKIMKSGLFAVDSFLAKEVADHFPNADNRTYEYGDGRFSCYYDAVAGKIAKHSFVKPEDQETANQYRIEDWWRAQHGLPEKEV